MWAHREWERERGICICGQFEFAWRCKVCKCVGNTGSLKRESNCQRNWRKKDNLTKSNSENTFSMGFFSAIFCISVKTCYQLFCLFCDLFCFPFAVAKFFTFVSFLVCFFFFLKLVYLYFWQWSFTSIRVH